MTWNVLAVAPLDTDSGRRYPTLTKTKPGFVLWPDETVVVSHDFAQLNVYHRIGDTWQQTYHSVGNKGIFTITSHRLVVRFDSVPKNRSFFTPLAAAQAAAELGKHRGEGCGGHVLHRWVAAVAARPRSWGMPPTNLGMLRVITHARQEDGSDQMVMLEINKDKAPAIAAQLVQSLYRDRVERPFDGQTQEMLERWRDEAKSGFDPPPKEFATRGFEPCVVVPAS